MSRKLLILDPVENALERITGATKCDSTQVFTMNLVHYTFDSKPLIYFVNCCCSRFVFSLFSLASNELFLVYKLYVSDTEGFTA